MNTVRCKLVLRSLEPQQHGTAKAAKFEAQYDETIEEDRRFLKATPTGSFSMLADNPAVTDNLVVGKAYYFDMTEA